MLNIKFQRLYQAREDKSPDCSPIDEQRRKINTLVQRHSLILG
jgi:hypothetical protein